MLKAYEIEILETARRVVEAYKEDNSAVDMVAHHKTLIAKYAPREIVKGNLKMMKVMEIAKKDEEGKRDGKVSMAIQATPDQMVVIEKYMNESFMQEWCQYEEDGEKDGTVLQFWQVSRSDVAYFRAEFKKVKQQFK